MKPEDHDSVEIIDSLQVAAIRGEGLCVVDSAGHYWRLLGHDVIKNKDDPMGAAYRKAYQNLE